MSDEDDAPQDADDDGAPAPDNAASPQQAERKNRRIARERGESEKFWRDVFGSPVGRREMWAVLQAGRIGEQSFACGPNGFPQPEASWFAAGCKDFAQRLHDSWQIRDFHGVYLMRCENDPLFKNAPRPAERTV